MKKNIFQNVKSAKVTKSAFDLSHEKKLTGKMGNLYPIFLEEVVPGDKFTVSSETMIRMAPMIAPLMNRVDAYVHFFKVPNRIIWDEWEPFITGEKQRIIPSLTVDGDTDYKGSIIDYFGLPITFLGSDYEINALPIRAYRAIWNEYFRDQDLQAELDITLDETFPAILPRAYAKDYFTSARPWAQKGDPVKFEIDIDYKQAATTKGIGQYPSQGNILAGLDTGEQYERFITDSGGPDYISIENIDNASIDINDFRTAHRIQRWLERNARSGSRYVEHLISHWGVKSSDARLDRPEYIGGGKSPVVISEVLNTRGDKDPTQPPQGAMSGHGINIGNSNRCSTYCEEHGYIIGLLSVIPKTAYQQGINRKFSRELTTDYYFPEFARLGEQEVKNKEIYMSPDSEEREKAFGYQSRFSEYKYAPSMVCGDFRDNLDFYHLGRKFSEPPVLNAEFIRCDPDELERVFAVQDGSDNLWIQVYNNCTAVRPMPFYNDPTI